MLRYSLNLQNIVDKLIDNEERLTLLAYLYINRFGLEKCAKLFRISTEQTIICLKYEQFYKYRICSICQKLKTFDNFNKDKYAPDGITIRCKECGKESYTKYYKKNKTEIIRKKLEYIKNKYENNPEHIKSINKKSNLKNKQKISERAKEQRSTFTLYKSYHLKLELFDDVRKSPDNNEILEVRCAYCGQWFAPKLIQVRARLNAINSYTGVSSGTENRFYCSHSCKMTCPIYKKQIYYRGLEVQNSSREVQPELRQMVFDRDNYTCQKCNKHQTELVVGLHCHHIQGLNDNPIESADVDNCITVCKNCHSNIHSVIGCRYNDMKC